MCYVTIKFKTIKNTKIPVEKLQKNVTNSLHNDWKFRDRTRKWKKHSDIRSGQWNNVTLAEYRMVAAKSSEKLYFDRNNGKGNVTISK